MKNIHVRSDITNPEINNLIRYRQPLTVFYIVNSHIGNPLRYKITYIKHYNFTDTLYFYKNVVISKPNILPHELEMKPIYYSYVMKIKISLKTPPKFRISK